MKRILTAIAITVTLLCQGQLNAKNNAGCIAPVTDSASLQDRYLSKPDARKILGEKCHRTEISSDKKNDVLNYRCTYIADIVDPKTNKTGALYYLFEQYPDAVSAQKVYADIVAGNKHSPGFKSLYHLGDEALLHTDNTNFYLVMVRKGNRMIRMKINKVTSKTSANWLMKITKAMAAKL